MSTGTVFPGIDTRGRILATCVVGAGIEAAITRRFGWSPVLPAYLCLAGAAAAVVSATDLTTWRVPNRVVLPALGAGTVLLVLASGCSATKEVRRAWSKMLVTLSG